MYNPIFDFNETSSSSYWQSVYRLLVNYIIATNIPSSAIIAFVPDERIVLIKRRNIIFWSLPGGEIAWGETIGKNIRRKLAAQTGLKLLKIKHTAGLYYSTNNSQANSFVRVVVADIDGKIKIKDSTEVAEARLFSLNNLPSL